MWTRIEDLDADEDTRRVEVQVDLSINLRVERHAYVEATLPRPMLAAK